MDWQFTPYVLSMVIATAISVALALAAWRRRSAPGATWLAFLMLAVAEWSLGYTLELASVDLPTIVFWAKVEYLGIVIISGTWVAFALQYTGQGQLLKPRFLALLAVEPLVTLALVWTNDLHGLMWSSTSLDVNGTSSFLVATYGAWFWAHAAYSYLLLLFSTVLLIQAIVHSPHLYRGQAGALLIGALAPWVGNVLFLSGLSPFPHLDLTSFAFTATGLAMFWNLLRFRLLEIVPVARGVLIESMSDAVVVLDAQDRLVDLNPAAERLISRKATDAIGQPARTMFSAWPDLIERYRSVQEAHDELVVGADTAQQVFDLRISPLCDRRGNLTGRLLVLHDITERKKIEAALRQARDELEVRVQARTSDLATANEKLLAEIAERKRAEEGIQQRAEHQEALYRVSTELAHLRPSRELCEVVVRAVKEQLGYPYLGIFLMDPETGDRVLQAQSGWKDAPADWRLHPGEGLSGTAILTGEMQYYPDVTREPRYVPGLRGAHAELDIPIKIGPSVLGVINVEDVCADAFDAEDFAVLGAVANQLAVALENARLVDESQKSLVLTTRLYELSSRILTAATLEETARLVTETFRDGFVADVASIRLFDAQGRPEFKYSVGLSPAFYEGTHMRPDGLTLRAWKSGQPVIVNDPALLHPRVRAEGILSVIALPLLGDALNLGVLYLNYRRPHIFAEREVQLLSLFANQAALALKRVRLVEETRRRALEQSTLSDIARALNAELDMRQAFPAVVAGLRQLTHCDHASVTLLDAGNREYTVAVLDEPRMEWKPGDRVAATASNTTPNLLAGRAHVSRDLSTELDLPLEQTLYLAGVRSRVVLPLMAGATVLGGLNLASTHTDTFDEGQLPLLRQIADAVAISIENTRLFEAEQTRRAELSALYDLSRALAAAPPAFDSALELVARYVVETIHVTLARVLLLENEDLVVRADYPRRVLGRKLEVGSRAAVSTYPACQQVMEHNDPHVFRASNSGMTAQEHDALFLGLCQTICVVPLRADNRSLGLIVLGEERSEEREPFTSEKIRFARSIGDQAASALHRAELFDELERGYVQTVLALANAVEAKDSYTSDHVQYVAQMAIEVGREMGLSQREQESLRLGAILHDIGKIGIPDAILKKPGPLDAEEWKIMRQHPVIGERILVPIQHLRDAAQIVRHHHEKYDGSGYPDGLAGEAIPLGARILTVVDSYSAIIDRRLYKPARSHEQAVAELNRCAGTQFDPNVVDLFLRQAAQRVEIRPEAVHSV